ncbi:DNA polymerase IV [Thermosediminibacter oceani]|uniref:DNA polymerase IV n=1 Tax=Thermosediminibacter oceani (strain ATCC BAA-1034 / DSM 16646 / JW/IW-1228P) TaxID=555079 RepID=D9S1G3_THEOJ|nr:DNA polymerase IV [Thermosediminibacter oceani]ADL07240.1 DNA-directed DNA polymerase [Thermosediminibacter oceani DSM 16646]
MLSILHVDMNAFYASCHQALDPSLKGKPVIVAGDPKKRNGIVLTASYEARKFGVKTAMPNWQARKLCPHAVFIKPDYRLYVATSHRVLEILQRFSPVVEVFSIDEAWLDVTGCEGLFGDAVTIAEKIQRTVIEELSLPCSVGVSCNKLLAKMASDMKKPMGITVITPEDVPDVIWPLPVDELFGVGPRLAERLKKMNINTIGDLAAVPVEMLEAAFGLVGRHIHLFANGIDDSPVDPHSMDDARSMGHSITLPRDVETWDEAEAVLLSLAEQVGRRVRRGNYVGRVVTVTLRDSSFSTITRSTTIPHTSATEDIYAAAKRLLRSNWDGRTPLRLLGVSLSGLIREFDQISVFEADEKKKRLNRVIDEIRERFGDNAIFRAKLKSRDLIGQKGSPAIGPFARRN